MLNPFHAFIEIRKVVIKKDVISKEEYVETFLINTPPAHLIRLLLIKLINKKTRGNLMTSSGLFFFGNNKRFESQWNYNTN